MSSSSFMRWWWRRSISDAVGWDVVVRCVGSVGGGVVGGVGDTMHAGAIVR